MASIKPSHLVLFGLSTALLGAVITWALVERMPASTSRMVTLSTGATGLPEREVDLRVPVPDATIVETTEPVQTGADSSAPSTPVQLGYGSPLQGALDAAADAELNPEGKALTPAELRLLSDILQLIEHPPEDIAERRLQATRRYAKELREQGGVISLPPGTRPGPRSGGMVAFFGAASDVVDYVPFNPEADSELRAYKYVTLAETGSKSNALKAFFKGL